MKRTLLFLLPLAWMGAACERHSASSLPKHEQHGAAGHEAAPSHAPAEHAKDSHAAPAAKPEEAPKAGEAPKFFEAK